MIVTFDVLGEPRPKQSFRYSSKGGGYTSPNIKAWQETVAWQAKTAVQGSEYMTGNLEVSMIFRLGNKRRVDLDNLSKAVLDAMNEIVYKDDNVVVKLILNKMVVKENPGVSVIIKHL